MWSGSLVFWQGTRSPSSGRYSVRVFRPLAWSRIFACIFYTPSCAMFVRSVGYVACHQTLQAVGLPRPRSIRALVGFFARQFRSRPFRFTLSSFFSACYVAKSFFSSFAGGHFPALGYTGAIQVTTFVPAPMCMSSMPFISLEPDPNHIPVAVTTSPEVNHSSSSPELACHEAITVTLCRVSHRTHLVR